MSTSISRIGPVFQLAVSVFFLLGCSQPPAMPKNTKIYYQNYVKSSNALGFWLRNEIDPSQAKPNQYYWYAAYDAEGRIVVLESLVPPMCIETRQIFSYQGKGTKPIKRELHTVNECPRMGDEEDKEKDKEKDKVPRPTVKRS
jgi:hypothetical protein